MSFLDCPPIASFEPAAVTLEDGSILVAEYVDGLGSQAELGTTVVRAYVLHTLVELSVAGYADCLGLTALSHLLATREAAETMRRGAEIATGRSVAVHEIELRFCHDRPDEMARLEAFLAQRGQELRELQ